MEQYIVFVAVVYHLHHTQVQYLFVPPDNTEKETQKESASVSEEPS